MTRTRTAPQVATAEEAVRALLQHVGEDPYREGLKDTPGRYVRALTELTSGYSDDPETLLGKRFDKGRYDQVVLLSGAEYTSLCEHHLMPFSGTADIAYLPGQDGRIVGLSKLARLLHCYARRLQVQERMTQQIGEALTKHLGAQGVAVIVSGHHHCMSSRGVRCRGTFITSYNAGVYRDDPAARAEVLSLLARHR